MGPHKSARSAWRRWLAMWRERRTSIEATSVQETANRKNLALLIGLRWLAVIGQVTTIAVTAFVFHIALPIAAMSAVITGLILVNLISAYRRGRAAPIGNGELFLEILIDVAALTLQLHLTGGVTNPFISLLLIQVILGAVLLQPLLSWLLVTIAAAAFLLLTVWYRDIGLPGEGLSQHGLTSDLLALHRWGMLICFLLAAGLQVLFVTRINRNLRQRDARVAELRQQSIEEAHIVRMGLLASGAAHELGSPLATLSVILSDWERMPRLAADAELGGELGEMKSALARCKAIVSRMLLTVGETRAEDAEPTSLIRFFDEIVEQWRQGRKPARIDFINQIRTDRAIVSDVVLRQALFNVFDNALEASPDWVGVEVTLSGDRVVIKVHDKGPGFPDEVLSRFGRPYVSTKARAGRGLGLYLVTNVLRTLGGAVEGRNNPEGGATVTVRFPVSVLALGAPDGV